MGGSAVVTAQLATYSFSPAFPQMVVSLNCRPEQVQLTISAYLLGYTLGQLFCGPMSDYTGRRKGLLGGLAVFIIGNLVSAAATSLDTLLLCLFITSMGAGGLPAMSFSLIRDVYSARDIPRVMSYLVTTMTIVPILAPLLGGHVAHWLGWREVFVCIGALGALVMLGFFFLLPETSTPPEERFSLKNALIVYASLLSNRRFMGYVLLLGFGMAQFVVLFSAAPFIFETNLKMNSAQYGQWFLVVCLGYPAGAIWSRTLLKTMSLPRLGLLGVVLTGIGNSVGVLGAAFIGPSLSFVVPGILIVSLGLGFCITVGRAGVLASIQSNTGFGSGLMGFFMFIIGAVVNVVASRFEMVTHHNLAIAGLVCAGFGWAALRLVPREAGK
jgi:DHA1 family bicyclomycin/chloramphenicol resistance-like MFS transporter